MQGPKSEPSCPWVVRNAGARGARTPASNRASWNSHRMKAAPRAYGGALRRETQLGLAGSWQTPLPCTPNPETLTLWLSCLYPCLPSWPPLSLTLSQGHLCVQRGCGHVSWPTCSRDHPSFLSLVSQVPPVCWSCFVVTSVLMLCIAVEMEILVL